MSTSSTSAAYWLRLAKILPSRLSKHRVQSRLLPFEFVSLFSASWSVRKAKEIGFSWPSEHTCDRIAPNPLGDASTVRIIVALGLKWKKKN